MKRLFDWLDSDSDGAIIASGVFLVVTGIIVIAGAAVMM